MKVKVYDSKKRREIEEKLSVTAQFPSITRYLLPAHNLLSLMYL